MSDQLDLAGLKLAMGGLFAAAARKNGGRGTHRVGVGGRGTLVLRPDLDLPFHRELRRGRQLDVVLRHANLNGTDDLAADFRGAALKLTRGPQHVLDLPMNTGCTTVWRTAAHFGERMRLFAQGKLADFYVRYPDALERYWDGARRAPARFTDLRYHSKVALRYEALDGSVHAIRFRLSPADDRPETGLPTARDRADGPVQTARWSSETRPEDTVRQRFIADLTAGPLHYRLDAKVRPATDDPNAPLHDPTVVWSGLPWRPLGDLTLTEVVPVDILDSLRFHFGRGPRTLRVFDARHATDLTSIGDLRASVYPLAAKARP